MNISTISYWFFEAFESMRKNMKNVLISVSTMFATMLIVAVGYLIIVNANYIIEQKQEDNSKILAYLDINVSEENVKNINTKLLGMEGVTKAEYFAQDNAINEIKRKHPELIVGYSLEELKNLIPPYFKVTFNTIEAQDEIVRVLRTLEGVGTSPEDVMVSDSAEDSIKNAQAAQIIAVTAMILIVELSVFLMINTTKLMLYARRKEISIMKYVGAKDGFVKMPFAIEGVIMSIIAVVIVIILVSICYEPIINMIGNRAGYQYLNLKEVIPNLRLILLAIGCFIGAFGSTMSMNKYLDV